VRALGRAAALALVLVALMAASGCGLGANDDPQPLDRDNVPRGALDEGEEAQLPSGDTTEVTVYFFQTDESGTSRLVPRAREVLWPADAETRIQALLTQPPDDVEQTDGISTFVPEDASILSRPRLQGGVLVVNLSENFYNLQGDSSRNAFAQLVYTATEVPGVTAVRFQQDGRTFEALDGDGRARTGPVGRDAYRNLASD
jgi:spore germination protein GerM